MSLTVSLMLSVLSFIVCLTILWLLMTFAAASNSYWWPESLIHLTSSLILSSQCCYLTLFQCLWCLQIQWVTKVIETQTQQYSLNGCFIVWGSVSPLLFCSLMVLIWLWRMLLRNHWPVIEEQLKMPLICPCQPELAPGLTCTGL